MNTIRINILRQIVRIPATNTGMIATYVSHL